MARTSATPCRNYAFSQRVSLAFGTGKAQSEGCFGIARPQCRAAVALALIGGRMHATKRSVLPRSLNGIWLLIEPAGCAATSIQLRQATHAMNKLATMRSLASFGRTQTLLQSSPLRRVNRVCYIDDTSRRRDKHEGLRSFPFKKASPDLDRMVPSWRFSMLAAFARNIAGVAIHANLSQSKTAPAHH